jgi:hypothetical protein
MQLDRIEWRIHSHNLPSRSYVLDSCKRSSPTCPALPVVTGLPCLQTQQWVQVMCRFQNEEHSHMLHAWQDHIVHAAMSIDLGILLRRK